LSLLEKLRSLDEQRAKLLADVKAEGLEKAEKAIAELNELGFRYRLVEGALPSAKLAGTSEPKRAHKDVPCPICGFKTDALHDGRAHRSQVSKKPFTAAELTEKGLKKV
jgi:hypothetical protein